MKKLGLYIHIPFCKRKCAYCDFVSYPGMEHLFDRYIDAVIAEAWLYRDDLCGYSIDTVFIGGGTPSLLLPGQMERLLSGLKDICNWHAGEITAEANPETLDPEKITAYAQSGINRLSIGLQTHDNDILQRIGRRHTFEDFVNKYDTVKRSFANINVDTIFGLPGQSLSNFQTTMQLLIDFSVPHISVYSLKLEPGTALAESFDGIDEELDRQMYHSAVRLLEEAGYIHYETSNFAKPGKECRHNLKYWMNQEYLGLGIAAHSYVDFGYKERFNNTECLEDYFRMISQGEKPVAGRNGLSDTDEQFEYIMLRLRLKQGIKYKDYDRRFSCDFKKAFETQIERAKTAGLITKDANGIYPTLKGFDLQNTLITEFIKKV